GRGRGGGGVAGGGRRGAGWGVGGARVGGGVGGDGEGGGERAVGRPGPVEREGELDPAAARRQVDLALGALVLDAAPRDVAVAAIRDRRRRHAAVGADRDLGDAAAEDQAVPRADDVGRDRARRAALALTVAAQGPHGQL